MSLLGKFPNFKLRELLEQKEEKGLDEEELSKFFGYPPYYFVEDSNTPSPKYNLFVAEYEDEEGRQYKLLEKDKLGVKFPIRKNREKEMSMPTEGEDVILTNIKTKERFAIRVISSSMAIYRSATGWIDFVRIP